VKDFKPLPEAPDGPNPELSPRIPVGQLDTKAPADSPHPGGVRQKSAPPALALTLSVDDLTDLLALATAAKKWDRVAALSAQLHELAQATRPEGVISLAEARKRRDEGGGK
jgi:hypothetical protein